MSFLCKLVNLKTHKNYFSADHMQQFDGKIVSGVMEKQNKRVVKVLAIKIIVAGILEINRK